MNGQFNKFGRFFLIVVAILLTALAVGLLVKQAGALSSDEVSEHFQYGYGAGECFANRAEGDFLFASDPVCGNAQGLSLRYEVATPNIWNGTVTAVVTAIFTQTKEGNDPEATSTTPPAIPTLELTSVPTIEVTQAVTEIPPTDVVIILTQETATPPATEPPAIVTDEPPAETETPDPTEEVKECKNKNSGKDGTPEECNAGGGQEKH